MAHAREAQHLATHRFGGQNSEPMRRMRLGAAADKDLESVQPLREGGVI